MENYTMHGKVIRSASLRMTLSFIEWVIRPAKVKVTK